MENYYVEFLIQETVPVSSIPFITETGKRVRSRERITIQNTYNIISKQSYKILLGK